MLLAGCRSTEAPTAPLPDTGVYVLERLASDDWVLEPGAWQTLLDTTGPLRIDTHEVAAQYLERGWDVALDVRTRRWQSGPVSYEGLVFDVFATGEDPCPNAVGLCDGRFGLIHRPVRWEVNGA